MGNNSEFKRAVSLVTENLSFNFGHQVQVFEATIRFVIITFSNYSNYAVLVKRVIYIYLFRYLYTYLVIYIVIHIVIYALLVVRVINSLTYFGKCIIVRPAKFGLISTSISGCSLNVWELALIMVNCVNIISSYCHNTSVRTNFCSHMLTSSVKCPALFFFHLN